MSDIMHLFVGVVPTATDNRRPDPSGQRRPYAQRGHCLLFLTISRFVVFSLQQLLFVEHLFDSVHVTSVSKYYNSYPRTFATIVFHLDISCLLF